MKIRRLNTQVEVLGFPHILCEASTPCMGATLGSWRTWEQLLTMDIIKLAKKLIQVSVPSYGKPKSTFWPTQYHSLFSSVQFSRSVMSDSLQPHELQHARPPRPAPTPRVHSDSRPSSPWCHPDISSCHPLLLLPPIPPSIRVFMGCSALIDSITIYLYIKISQNWGETIREKCP